MTAKGRVKWFDATKGYGFIVLKDTDSQLEREIYVHRSGIRGEGFRALEAGQEVEFEISEERGVQAQSVTPSV